MKRPKMSNRSAYLLAVFSLLGCGPSMTQLSTWHDPGSRDKQFSDVFVMVLIDDITVRRDVESRVVADLQETGIDAVASMDVLSPEHRDDYKTVESELSERGVNGIMVIKPEGTRDITVYVPEETYYETYTEYTDDKGHVIVKRKVTTGGYDETIGEIIHGDIHLYDNATDKLVWTAQFETETYGDLSPSIASFSKVLVASLIEDNLIAIN
jgi:hypothetical protein